MAQQFYNTNNNFALNGTTNEKRIKSAARPITANTNFKKEQIGFKNQ